MKEDFRHFFEDKNRLIDRLDLTDEQKEELKTFFQKHPNYENKIDWNNKSLQYKDFESVLSLEGSSENSKKKYGLSGKAQIEDLVEGKDYLIIAEKNEKYYHTIIYYPLTFKASEVLAKPTTPPLGITGKWCIAGRNYSPGTRDQHWNQYTNDGTDFFFVFSTAKEGRVWDKQDLEAKFAISRTIDDEINVFDSNDREIDGNEYEDFGYDEDGNWLEDRDENYPGTDPDIDWALKIIEQQKPEKVFMKDRFYIDRYGVRFSKDKRKLERCPPSVQGSYRIPEGTEVIMPSAFADCRLSKVEIPGFIKVIESSAFHNARFLTQVIIEDGVEEINSRAFKNCSWLKEVIIPDSVRKIEDAAFMGCTLLRKIKLPAGLNDLHSNMFTRCAALEEIIWPKKLTWIWSEVFTGCEFLQKLTLPPTLEFIKNTAFAEAGVRELELYPTSRPLAGFQRSKIEKIIYHGTGEEFKANMPVFFDEYLKEEAVNVNWAYRALPWGCQVYCTEDNKTFIYTKPAQQT